MFSQSANRPAGPGISSGSAVTNLRKTCCFMLEWAGRPALWAQEDFDTSAVLEGVVTSGDPPCSTDNDATTYTHKLMRHLLRNNVSHNGGPRKNALLHREGPRGHQVLQIEELESGR